MAGSYEQLRNEWEMPDSGYGGVGDPVTGDKPCMTNYVLPPRTSAEYDMRVLKVIKEKMVLGLSDETDYRALNLSAQHKELLAGFFSVDAKDIVSFRWGHATASPDHQMYQGLFFVLHYRSNAYQIIRVSSTGKVYQREVCEEQKAKPRAN